MDEYLSLAPVGFCEDVKSAGPGYQRQLWLIYVAPGAAARALEASVLGVTQQNGFLLF